MIASEAETTNELGKIYRKASEFRLCRDTVLCNANLDCSHKYELCVVEHGDESKIVYDTIHKYVILKFLGS